MAALLATASSVSLVQAAEAEYSSRPASEIRLQLGGSNAFSQSLENLMPGDSVAQAILVRNDGAEELRYSLSISSENPDGKRLGDALAVAVRTSGEASTRTCGAFGTALFTGTLGADGGFGDSAAGADPGDRTLGPGTTEALCLRITLPLEADNAYQGARTTMSFTFSAEQTRGNP